MPDPIEKPRLIAIAGGSGSGKSWLASGLASGLPGRVEVICMDAFYRDRSHLSPAQLARVNFDHPRAIEHAPLLAAIHAARTGTPFTVPVYDYARHARSGTREVRPGRWLIFEGLWLLRTRALRSLFDWRIFVAATAKWRRDRRLERDVGERARKRASIVRQFREQVEPMHRRHVQPQASLADIAIRPPISGTALAGLVARLCGGRPQDEKSRT